MTNQRKREKMMVTIYNNNRSWLRRCFNERVFPKSFIFGSIAFPYSESRIFTNLFFTLVSR
jgi:hypothetical protein